MLVFLGGAVVLGPMVSGAISSTGTLLYYQPGDLLPYLILVTLIWAGMRFGTSAAATAGFVVALGVNIATSQGFGPFSSSTSSVDAVTLQIFLAIAMITTFVVAAMASDLADRDEVHRLLTHQATHDHLTGLANRALFGQRLDETRQMHGRIDGAVGVLVINLDDFKKLNDRFGSLRGDETLRLVLIDCKGPCVRATCWRLRRRVRCAVRSCRR